MRLEAEEGIRPEQAVYVHAGEDAQALRGLLRNSGIAVVNVAEADWNRDLSPWAAEAAFRKGEAFAGGGPAHLARLLESIEVFERKAGWAVQRRGIAGYSLAGLFALYAGYECDRFDFAVSASGSLWYDGFLPYMRAGQPKLRRAYLSLGDREPHTRNPRLAGVGEATLEAERTLRAQGVETRFEWNEGNHFQDPTWRLAKGILWAGA